MIWVNVKPIPGINDKAYIVQFHWDLNQSSDFHKANGERVVKKFPFQGIKGESKSKFCAKEVQSRGLRFFL